MTIAAALAGKKILIVEDNFFVAEDLRLIVEEAKGEASRSFHSAREALACLAKEHFDGAFLDVQLLGSSSAEVARRLNGLHIPFVVVTGYSRDWLAPELRRAPYLSKPFNREDLVEVAANHFAARGVAGTGRRV